ncbi:MAG: glycoside hydrolase N-terminal domain-containing protein [Ferruginibacter sp.]
MNKITSIKYFLCVVVCIYFTSTIVAQPKKEHNLQFDSLATRWDEAIPLGNGWLGALIYKKGNHIRMALDRVDVWDDRPMPEIDKLKFKWVVGQVKKNEYDTVQKIGDEPYEANAAPTKIPCAAIEFNLSKIGKVLHNELDIATAINTIQFDDGITCYNYVHATAPIGYFIFSNIKEDIIPEIKIPNYNSGKEGAMGNSVEGQGLERLGYAKGTVTTGLNFIRYHQPCWKGNYYEVLVQWKRKGNTLMGQWTISNNKKAVLPKIDLSIMEPTQRITHLAWWKNYWSKSGVTVPDKKIEKQYYLELYKMGCVARENTPPISLQAIWTADNGNLPPWKGDIHNDLNTELSYWPFYTANHLNEAQSFTNWLWKVKGENEKWTRAYFGTEGLNVPGVTTISGKPMGGWIQYSMSPSTGAWLSQHFYWQWKYSMDTRFLKSKALNYVIDARKHVLNYLKEYSPNSVLSSSPEYHDNSIKAWFNKLSSYDWALYKNSNEMAIHMNEVIKATGTPLIATEIPKYIDSLFYNETGLPIAPNQNLDESHRHHTQLMAIYPLGLLSTDNAFQKNIINNSLRHLEKMGTRQWCGYSFSWAACLYSRAKEGDNAAKMLQIFNNNYVSSNSLHLNGEKKGGEYSDFK